MTEIIVGSLLLITLILLQTIFVVAARAALVPDRSISLRVNGDTTIPARTGQKLLTALTDNGILIPSACAGAGTCGLCRVQIPDGPDLLPVEAARFSRSEARAGMHLACQVVLRDDMALQIDEALLSAETFELNVVSTRQLTPLISEVVLQMPTGRVPDIHAGSFLQITAPPYSLDYQQIDVPPVFEDQWTALRHLSISTGSEVTRAYSVANRPEDTEAGLLVLNIRLALPPPSVPGAPPGVVSSYLFSRRSGDRISASGPYGSFQVQNTEREMVFIGGGVGMAPLRAMIFEQLSRQDQSRKITFWYGARSADDLYYVDELNALAARHPNFEWTVAISDPQHTDGWSGRTGFVHSVVYEDHLRDHPAPENCEYYLCGPPLMTQAVLAMLDDLGVEPDHIFNDDFGV